MTIGTMGDIEDSGRGSQIPYMYGLRRVPMRYYRTLPLTVMKQFQCLVVGSAPGVLTVAITDRQNTLIIEALREYTGKTIFPVLIDETRMRLLIQRLERNEHKRSAFYRVSTDDTEIAYGRYCVYRLQVGSLVRLLSNQKTRRV